MKKGLMEKTILSGLGLASLTQDKVQKLVYELVKEGEMSEKEGIVMAKKAMDNIEKGKKEMENRINQTVKEILAKADLPTKKDMAALEKKLDELNRKLESKNGNNK